MVVKAEKKKHTMNVQEVHIVCMRDLGVSPN